VRQFSSLVGSQSAARIFSIVGLPPVLAFPTAFLAANGQPGGAVAVSVLVICGCIIPTAITVALFRTGRTFTLDLRERGERALPSAATAIGCAATWGWLQMSGAPSSISALTLGVAVQMALLAVLTMRWKVSYHSASACLLAAVSRMHQPPGITLALICLAVCVAWSRVHLGRHTLAQVAAGALTAAPFALLT